MPAKDHDVLLEEYKVCESTVNRLDHLIWQMASILFPISLAGLTYFGVTANHKTDQFIVLVVVASGSIILTLNWFYLSRQWASYQKVAIYRMREIEKEVGIIWLYRYNAFVRMDKEWRKSKIEKTSDKQEKERLEKLYSFFDSFPFFGLFRSIRTLSSLFIVAWLVIIIKEAIFTFFVK
jgi:hypothetical protein